LSKRSDLVQLGFCLSSVVWGIRDCISLYPQTMILLESRLNIPPELCTCNHAISLPIRKCCHVCGTSGQALSLVTDLLGFLIARLDFRLMCLGIWRHRHRIGNSCWSLFVCKTWFLPQGISPFRFRLLFHHYKA